MSETAPTPEPAELSTSAALSRAVVRIHAQFYGRGPTRVRTVVSEGLITVVLEELFTPGERTLVNAGHFEQVRITRTALQDEVAPVLRRAVQEITGRSVRGLFSQIAPNDLGVEVFVLGDLARPGRQTSPARPV